MKKKIDLVKDGKCIPIIVENTAFLGVKKIAEKVIKDIETVSGVASQIRDKYTDILDDKQEIQMVIFATIGKSKLITDLSNRNCIDIKQIQSKREVFEIKIIHRPFEGVSQALVICGSDKRGTIYGMFQLSEIIGIRPLWFWGDVTPKLQKAIALDEQIEQISKEPSVKYRGFFINDEWPCFGSWAFNHYNGFTADMYDKVFELLLRLKGNYLWPAMWTSSFALDGPGLKSAELADTYGVIMGNSHHEPCLRASEEWDIYRGENTIYGNEWNFYTNEEGLLKYWEDGLKRSIGYETMITIGMRGERDSSMLGPDASLKQNIDLLKDIITKQRSMIKKQANRKNPPPELLALYKEVEIYFYGDEKTDGLKDWEGLEGVTLMLCEDNFGNMRTLPTEEMRKHKGGYGMYYHLDYHGDPISYEWVNSTPLSKIWEQMTMAYEYGVREVWVVNVGDLKFNEFPLSYFMNLAYDYEQYGITASNKTKEFTCNWISQQFGNGLTKEEQRDMEYILSHSIEINSIRKPESLNSSIYHPVHHNEADGMLKRAEKIISLANDLLEKITINCKNSYYSMIYFPAVASMNLLKMHLYAAKNEHYAKQGKKIANDYARLVSDCMKEDKRLANEFQHMIGGKWSGMQSAPHIGFTKWNEDNHRYPLRMLVEPVYKPRMVVSRADGAEIAVKDYFAPMVIEVHDFLYMPNQHVEIEIANDGIGELTFDVFMESSDWLSYQYETNTVKSQEILNIYCHREKLPKEPTMQEIKITDGETVVIIAVYGKAVNLKQKMPKTFMENNGVVVMDANHYSKMNQTSQSKLILLNQYGKSGHGIKVLPVTNSYKVGEGPSLIYAFYLEKEGDYTIQICSAPSNSVEIGRGVCYSLRVNDGEYKVIDTLSEDYAAGVPHNPGWTKGVLEQVRKSGCDVMLKRGENKIEIGFINPEFVLERVIVYPVDSPPRESYLGPKESFFI